MPEPTTKSTDSLSIPAKLLYQLGFPITIGALATISPPTAAYVPFVAAPTAYLLRQRARRTRTTRPGRLETLIWSFVGASTIGPLVNIIAQGILSYGSALLIFGEQTADYVKEFTRPGRDVLLLPPEMVQKRAVMASSMKYWAYLCLFSFTLAGLPEEIMKYALLTMIRRQQSDMKARDYTMYSTMIGLGYAFFENIAFIYASSQDDSARMIAVTAAERVLYGTAAHVFTAVLTGTLMAQRDLNGDKLSWWQILGPSTIYHGAGNFFLSGASASDGNVGWVHPQTGKQFLKYIALPLANLLVCALHVRANLEAIGVNSLFV